MSETLSKPVVPAFETVEGLCSGLEQRGRGTGIDLYPRDGTKLLSDTEARIGELEGVSGEYCLAYNTGMTAVSDAVDIAIGSSESETPTIAVAQQLYAKSLVNIRQYAERHKIGFRTFDSGAACSVEKLVSIHKPDVIVSETVSNGYDVPVLDHELLLDLTRDLNPDSTVILDHTLPLSSGYSVLEDIQEDDKVMVVESGTKAFALNRELLGLTFTKNPDLLEALRTLRCNRGSLPGVASLERISELLPDSKEEFDLRNRRVYANTGKLALTLFEASKDPRADFVVSHPAIPGHDNYDFSQTKNNGEISPIFYLQSFSASQKELAKRFERHPDVVRQSEFGQSFGFDEARILPDAMAPVVRIAGGANTNEELGYALAEAVLNR